MQKIIKTNDQYQLLTYNNNNELVDKYCDKEYILYQKQDKFYQYTYIQFINLPIMFLVDNSYCFNKFIINRTPLLRLKNNASFVS